MTEAFIFDTLRTPRGRGKSTGSLYEVKPIDLLTTLLKKLQSRHQLNTSEIDDLIIGCVTPVNEQGGDIAKAALLHAGWSDVVAGIQLNRFCASGLESVNMAAMKVRSGWGQMVIAGGVESMSRVPMETDGGPLLHDPEIMTGVGYIPQGVAADLIATIEGYDRKSLDTYALQSQQRAAESQAEDYFNSSIVPVCDRNGLLVLGKDEYLRPSTTLEKLAALPPAFKEIGAAGFDAIALRKYPQIESIQHLHTAGNSSGIVDGAALVVVGSKEKGKELGLKARARIISAVTVGSETTIMLTGPAPAARKALQIAGMKAKDIDLWEMNEAFAAPVLKFQKELKIPADRLNVNGGAIALGHPLGATGAILLGTLLDELKRRDLNTGLVTLCVGGGMGIATIIERTE